MGKKETGPAPMPRRILVGDKVKLEEHRRGPYVQQYGFHLADKVWQVRAEDKVSGRRRLTVDDVPSMLWGNDAKLAYTPQSKERREHLTALGVKLP